MDRTETTANPQAIFIRKSNGTASSPSAVSAGDAIGQISFDAYEPTNGFSGGSHNQIDAAIRAYVPSGVTPAAGNMPTNLAFRTKDESSISAVDNVTIQYDGNVGIGTTSPGEKLHVNGNIHIGATTTDDDADYAITSAGQLKVAANNAATQNDNYVGLILSAGTGTDRSVIRVNGSGSDTFRHISFATMDTERMRVDKDGNVGIGTTTPGAHFHLSSPDNNVTALVTPHGGPASLVFRRSNGTEAAPTAVQAGDPLGQVMGSGRGATIDFPSSAAKVTLNAAENWTDTTGAGDIRFFTRPSGSTAASTERMRVDKDGNLGLGTTSPATTFHIFDDLDNSTQTSSRADETGLKIVNGNATSGSFAKIFMSHAGDSADGFYFKSIYNGNNDVDLDIGRVDSATGLYPTDASRIFIKNTGNVGIGTTTPPAALTVTQAQSDPESSVKGLGYFYNSDTSSTADAIVTLRTASSTAGDPFIAFDILGDGGWSTGVDNSDSNKFKIASSWDQLTTNTRLTIDTSGKVGIGTTTPDYFLHVSTGTYNTAMKIESSGSDSYLNFKNTGSSGRQYLIDNTSSGSGVAPAGSLAVYDLTGGAARFVISPSGNVGIGTTTPAHKLDVDGDINVSSGHSYLTNGADYAEYFEASEEMESGDIVGLNPKTGLARRYQAGDALLGVVSTQPGMIGNNGLADQESVVLVALVGQVPFDKNQVQIKDGEIFTFDNKPLGYLLTSGNAYINLSSAHENYQRRISSLETDNAQIRAENTEIKATNANLERRLERLERLLENNK